MLKVSAADARAVREWLDSIPDVIGEGRLPRPVVRALVRIARAADRAEGTADATGA